MKLLIFFLLLSVTGFSQLKIVDDVSGSSGFVYSGGTVETISSTISYGGYIVTQTKIAGQNALVWDPGGSGKKKTIVVYNGLGNEGTDINKLLRASAGIYITNGTLKPSNAIIICVQQAAGQGWVPVVTYEKTLQEIYAKYPVDSFALTGYSAGAYAIFNYIEHRKTDLPICAIVPFSMDFENPNDFTLSKYKNIRVWALSGTGDSRYPNLKKMVDRLSAAGYQATITGYPGKHCCWPTYYNPSWKENGQSIYDFMIGAPPPPVFYSVQASGLFTRNNCGTAYTGSTVAYTVAARKYSASTQAAANKLATDEVSANGQAYANLNGACTPKPLFDFKIGDTIRLKVIAINDSTLEFIRIKN